METLFFAASLAALALAERLPAIRFRPLPFLRPWLVTDLVYFVTGATALGLALRELAVTAFGAGGVLSPLLAALPAVGVFAAAIVLYDLGGYLAHVLLHRYDLLWRIHQVHHSSLELDWLATFRAHALEHLLRHSLSSVALVLLGFPPVAVAVAAAVYGAWAAFTHSNLRWSPGPLERILVTPRLHRLHHVPATSEANLGTIFSLWDRLGGRLVTDPAAALTPIGVPGEVATYPQDWRSQLVAPFRPAASRRRPGRAASGPADVTADAA